jgi:hypothetical protein
MNSLSSSVARRRAFYPRPISSMPDILMIDVPVELRTAKLVLGRYHPILVETIAEQHELEAHLAGEGEAPSGLDLLDSRPSMLPADHLIVAHYAPPTEDWPFVLLCRWPSELAAAAAEELRMFVRNAYTIELFGDREQLEHASESVLALLRRRRSAKVEFVLPDWSAVPGTPPH